MTTRIDTHQPRSTGTALSQWRTARVQEWNRGDRHLAYTLLAIVGLALLGAVVVPLSIPEEAPALPREQVLADQYLAAIAAPDAPAAVRAEAAKEPALTQAEIVSQFGADGGPACAGKVDAAYATLLTPRPGGGTSFNRDAFARMQAVQGVYCPERAAEMTELIRSKQASNARARTLAAQDEAAATAAA